MADTNTPEVVEEEKQQVTAKTSRWTLKKKLLVAGAAFLALTGLAVGLGVGLTRHHGSSSSDSDSDSNNELKRSTKWQPAPGTPWQIILISPLTLASAQKPVPDVPIWDLDVWDNSADIFSALHKNGKKVICYFSAGSYENWRPDKNKFHKSDLGKPLDGWAGERWLNVSSPNVRSIMADRIKMAAGKGCDAIDPDNVDGYQNDNGLGLTKADAISYMKFLSTEASKYNMATGLKNAGGIISSVLSYVHFSVNEQCVEFEECTTFSPFIKANKPVFNIEYPKGAPGHVADSRRQQICANKGVSAGASGFSHIIKAMKLNGWAEYCDGKTYTTATQS